MKNKGRLVVISGPSGVGKGTVIRRLLGECENLRLSVSATTREPRNEDTEGVTYFFKTVDEFRSMIDGSEFLEWAVYNGNYYGTPCTAVEENLNSGLNVILEIDVQGALEVMKKRPDAIYIFIAPPDRDTLMQRLVGRGTETEEQINKRCAAAVAELEQQDKYDFVVVNDVLDDAVEEIKSIIEGKNVK